MSEHPSRICIVGGGFGGLYTALRLNQFPWNSHQAPEITLVDRNDRFLFVPLLYELITNELQAWEIAPSFEKLLGPKCSLIIKIKKKIGVKAIFMQQDSIDKTSWS